jgi:hypothetical protein
MADRESIYAWLAGAKYRIVEEHHPAYRIVLRLIDERRAEWLGAAYRVRALPDRASPHAKDTR